MVTRLSKKKLQVVLSLPFRMITMAVRPASARTRVTVTSARWGRIARWPRIPNAFQDHRSALRNRFANPTLPIQIPVKSELPTRTILPERSFIVV